MDAGGELIEYPRNFLEKVKAALASRGGADALAETAELRSTINSLEAKLADSEQLVDGLRKQIAGADEKLAEMRANQASVLDLVTEAGFAPEEAASLPVPDAGDGDEIKAAEAALAEVESKGGREVYAAVKRLQEARAAAQQ